MFYVILNPNDGPGASGTQAPLFYQECIPSLRADNVKILGYVASGANTATDIATYAGWDSSYVLDGIFFSGVSSASADYSTYSAYSTSVRTNFDSGAGYVSTLLWV